MSNLTKFMRMTKTLLNGNHLKEIDQNQCNAHRLQSAEPLNRKLELKSHTFFEADQNSVKQQQLSETFSHEIHRCDKNGKQFYSKTLTHVFDDALKGSRRTYMEATFKTLHLEKETVCELKFEESIQKQMIPSQEFILAFDIDNCLYYSEECHLAELAFWAGLQKRLINEWNLKNQSNSEGKEPKTLKQLKTEYNSPRIGILKFYGKPMDYIVECDFNEAHRYIKKNDELIKLLKSLPFRKICFTNGFPVKAEPILKKLEILDQFESVICCNENYDCNDPNDLWISKPMPLAFQCVESFLETKGENKIVFFDDRDDNITTARLPQFNWITYKVTPENDIVYQLKQFQKDYCNEKNGFCITNEPEVSKSNLFKRQALKAFSIPEKKFAKKLLPISV